MLPKTNPNKYTSAQGYYVNPNVIKRPRYIKQDQYDGDGKRSNVFKSKASKGHQGYQGFDE